ncbi:hypothetical protein CPB84DRAFT_762411 [Gymnopilus junonius]|uniref:Uncharacterized protein n=1 Tax=Gymnopilus junonius TaxID=109634 RepID=A0A9P5P007_GYMJU|nr:hypothetical protein CPB84DRAFT_762411 [Gymnopilus junonius]
MLEVAQQTEKHLPRIPVQPDEATSQTGLFEGIPHVTSTVADSLKENLEPLVVDSDKVSSGLLLDKLATDNSSFKDDIFPNPNSLEDRGHTSQKRTFLDRRLVALSVAESSISSSSDDLAKQSIGTADADSSEQTRKTASDSREQPLEPEISQTTPNLTLQDAQRPKPISEPDSNKQELDPSRSQRSKSSFPSFLHKLATVPNPEPIPNTSSSSTQRTAVQYHPLPTDLPPPRSADDLEISTDIQPPDFIPTSTSNSTSISSSSLSNDDQEKKSRRKRPQNTFLMLQPIVKSGNNLSPPPPKPSSSGFTPSTLGVDSSFAKRMEETGRLRRLQSQKNIAPDATGLWPLSLSPNPSQSSLTPGKSALNGSAHPKIRLEGDVLSPHSASSVPPSFKAVQTKINELSQSDDQDALHEFLERTLRELEETQREAALVKAQSNLDKIRLEEQLKDANEEVAALRKENELQKKEIATFEKQLKNKERDVLRLSMEKQNWQEQLDTMHHRLNQAERQMRCLDHLTRSKVEARVEGVYGPTRRAKLLSPIKEPSVEVMGALSALNEEILQSANLLVENLERTKSAYPTSDDTTLARTMLGSKVTTMVQAQANDRSKAFRFLLMQVVLEVFMVNWCTSIIEGWYPKQQSFADLLIEMNSKVATSSAPRVDCGKVKIIQTNISTTVPSLV